MLPVWLRTWVKPLGHSHRPYRRRSFQPHAEPLEKREVPSAATESYVGGLYEDVLGRRADPGGLVYYSGRLDQGSARDQVVREIVGSEEARAALVRDLYRTLLGREADPGGLAAYAGFLNRGGSVDDLRWILLRSQEYSDRAGTGDTAYLRALYRDLVGREPDPEGAAAYRALMHRFGFRYVLPLLILQSDEGRLQQVRELTAFTPPHRQAV